MRARGEGRVVLVSPRSWATRARPQVGGALDQFTPLKAGGAGVVLSALNPKNLLPAIAGAAAIAQTGISTGQLASYVIFVAIASIGVAAPVVGNVGPRRLMLQALRRAPPARPKGAQWVGERRRHQVTAG